MKAVAYPLGSMEAYPIPEAPIKEWKALAKRIELELLHAKKRTGLESTVDKEIDNVTRDWALTQRERFRHWYKNTYTSRHAELASGNTMIKQALYSPHGSEEVKQKFEDKRMSVIKRIRRLQNEIGQIYRNNSKAVEWSDARYPSGQAKVEAILHALNTVCVLLDTLQTKEITAAVLVRTARHITHLDPAYGQKFREIVGEQSDIIRFARSNEISAIAAELKKELDCFYYGIHLRRLYSIYDQLGKLGLTSLQGDLEQLIQKSLPDVTAIHKQLSEVYTAILEIPAEHPAEKIEQQSQAQSAPVDTVEESEFQSAPVERQNVPAADISR